LGHERTALLQRAVADQQQRHQAEQDDGALQEERRAVDGHRAAGGQDARVRLHHDPDERGHEAEQRQHELGRATGVPGQRGLEEHPDAGDTEQDQHRRDGAVVDRRKLEILHQRDAS
jgi:hypothetical protein